MLKRLLVGLIVGIVIGGSAAAVLVQGLGLAVFTSAALAYLAAAATGVLTGLIAGKPIWSAGGRIEAGLKAFAGGLLALGGMFALRQWGHTSVDLSAFNAGAGEIGLLPATSLPLIAALLAAFFEIDNTPGTEGEKNDEAAKTRAKAGSSKKIRVPDAAEEDDADAEEQASAKKLKQR